MGLRGNKEKGSGCWWWLLGASVPYCLCMNSMGKTGQNHTFLLWLALGNFLRQWSLCGPQLYLAGLRVGWAGGHGHSRPAFPQVCSARRAWQWHPVPPRKAKGSLAAVLQSVLSHGKWIFLLGYIHWDQGAGLLCICWLLCCLCEHMLAHGTVWLMPRVCAAHNRVFAQGYCPWSGSCQLCCLADYTERSPLFGDLQPQLAPHSTGSRFVLINQTALSTAACAGRCAPAPVHLCAACVYAEIWAHRSFGVLSARLASCCGKHTLWTPVGAERSHLCPPVLNRVEFFLWILQF